MWSYKDHGKSFKKYSKKNPKPGFRWLHDSFGTNFRMTEMQSAIGREQLKKINLWNKKRNRNADKLNNLLSKHQKIIRLPPVPDNINHAYYKFYSYIVNEGLKAGWTRDKVILEINNCGIPCFSGSCSEIYLEDAFLDSKYLPKKRLSNAKELGETSIMFLVHPTLKQKDLDLMVKQIDGVLTEATA